MQTKIKTLDQKYLLLQRKMMEALLQAAKKGEVSNVEVLAFLQIFSNVENYWELRLFINAFAKSFPFLGELDETVREIQKNEVELFLEQKLPELLKSDPMLVVEISKFAAQPKTNLVKLFEKFEQLKK